MAKKDGFSNNAATTLAQAILEDATVIQVADGSRFLEMSSGQALQRATITNKGFPGEFEIVAIQSMDNENANLFTVVRGIEGTATRAWPAESKIEARLTAGQLNSFLQVDENGIVRGETQSGTRSFVVNGKVANNYEMVQISGIQQLQRVTAKAISGSQGSFRQDLNMSVESVGGTPFVELGDNIPVYAEGQFLSDRNVVKGPTATGYNYLLDLSGHSSGSDYIHTPVAMFDNSGSSFPAIGPAGGGGEEGAVLGQWLPLPDPLNLILTTPIQAPGLVLSEVGFICALKEATTAPVVSIMLLGEDTEHVLVDHVALDAITRGANQVHRFPVSSYGGAVSGIRIRLDTKATGKFYGRFYWRGFFFDVGA